MNIISFLLQVWAIIGPFLGTLSPNQIKTIMDALQKAVVDFNGQNYVAVVSDVIAILKVILPPDQQPRLDALLTQ